MPKLKSWWNILYAKIKVGDVHNNNINNKIKIIIIITIIIIIVLTKSIIKSLNIVGI